MMVEKVSRDKDSDQIDYVYLFDYRRMSEIIKYFSMNEVWVPVYGYADYRVSSFGRIMGKGDKIFSLSESHGYKIASLRKSGKTKNLRVHRLVLMSFVGDPPFKEAQAAHNDGDKSNNNISNLRWATAKENQADVNRHGNRVVGSKVHGAKLTEKEIPKIRRMISEGVSYPKIADKFGVSISTISLIKLGRIWRHA